MTVLVTWHIVLSDFLPQELVDQHRKCQYRKKKRWNAHRSLHPCIKTQKNATQTLAQMVDDHMPVKHSDDDDDEVLAKRLA